MTSLAQQLKKLAVPQAQSALGLPEKERKSLLFDAKEAANLDKETFYAIGANGFHELLNIDPSFAQFETNLFDEASKSFQRAVQNQELNQVLDQRIQSFLMRVSPYFLLRPAQKALEWLIYRFHIHLYNTDDLVRCILPYHDSKIFIRVVQILSIKEETNKWHWLYPLQAPGVPLSKTALINHCYKDLGFLKFVCDTVSLATQDTSSTDGSLRTTFTFYTSTIVGAIEFASPLTENFIAALAPYLVEGAKNKRFIDFNAATYMIISQLCLKATLKLMLLEPLMQCICKYMKPALSMEALSCLALICQTQSLQSFPKKSFKLLCKKPALVDSLHQLSQVHNITPLLKLLLTQLVHSALDQSAEGEELESYTLLSAMLSGVQLNGALANMVCRLLLTQYITLRQGITQKKLIKQLGQKFSPLIQTLETRYCEAVDEAITTYMAGEREPGEKSYANEFVQLSVASAKHQVIGDSETSETTLVLSLNHALATQRMMAVEHLRKTMQEGEEFDMSFLKASLLERLGDENLSVVAEVLMFEEKLCDIIPPAELMEPLQKLLLRWRSKTKKSWLKVGQQILAIIISAKFLECAPSLRHRCAALLLPHLFLASNETLAEDQEVILMLESSALVTKHPLLVKSSTVYSDVPSKVTKKYLSGKTNAMVELLASNLAGMEAKEQQLMVNTMLEYCHKKQAKLAAYRVLVATVLTRALHSIKNESQQLKMAHQLMDLLDEDVKKMQDPEFKMNETPESNAPTLDHTHDTLPTQYHGHLSRLLTSKRKTLKMGAVSLDISQIEIVFWCLENLIVAVKMTKTLKKDKRWWTLSKSSEQEAEARYLTLLLRIFDSLTQGAADSRLKKDPERFRNLIKTVLEHHLNSTAILFKFFALVWTSHCQRAEDMTYRVSALYQARLLHMGCISIKSMQQDEVKKLLESESTVVPALLLALSSQLYPIRQAAIAGIHALHTSGMEGASPLWHLVKAVTGSGQSIIDDADHLHKVLSTFFAKVTMDIQNMPATPSRKKKPRKGQTSEVPPANVCLDQLLIDITGENTPVFIQQTLLGLLLEVDNKVVFTSVLSMLSEILTEATQPESTLSYDKVMWAHHAVGHYTPATAECLVEESEALELLLKVMSIEGGLYGLESLQFRVLKQISPGMYSAISNADIQQTLLAKLIDLQVDAKSSSVASRIGKTLRKLELEGDQLVSELNKVDPESRAKSLRDAKKARLRAKAASSDSEATSADDRAWQRVSHILEHVQQRKMKRINNIQVLVPALFNILAKCMEPDIAGTEMEYIKHLILTSLLTLCNKLSPDNKPIPQDILSESLFNVELIVKCIRTSDDPQTHNHALLLLATAAGIFPEHVLHNTMTIFTFMGASVLRKDDSYSFQVITKTIDSVIPALIKASEEKSLPAELSGGAIEIITMVMRVFVDALPHTPEHRRIPIFSQLMLTIGGEEHLWRMLGLLIGSYATKGDAVIHPGEQIDTKDATRSMEFWLSLCEQFECDVIVSNLIQLLKYLSTLPEEKDDEQPARRTKRTPAKKTAKSESENLFDVSRHTDRHLRQFKFATISFLPQVLSSEHFVEQMIYLPSDKEDQLNDLFQRLLEESLRYITHVAHSVQRNANKATAKFWKALLHRSYEVLDKVNALLPAETFIQVVSGLLGNSLPTVRRKAMELLNNKLMNQKDYFDEDQIPLLLTLLGDLCTVAKSTKSSATSVEEVDINRQTALYSLKLLCKVIGHLYPKELQSVLDVAVKTLKEDGLNQQVAASAMLCLAETFRSLQAHAIGHLPDCMPILLGVLENKQRMSSSDLHLLSAVTSLQKIIETLPNFLSPYLLQLILQITKFSSNTEDEKSQLNLRLKAIRHRLATSVSARVMLPAIAQAYGDAADKRKESIGPLMSMLGDHMGALSNDDLHTYHSQIISFFLVALDYRAKHTEMLLEEVGQIESCVINSLVSMVMKLSEATFRPMYLKLYDWASRGSSNKERLLTFYHLSDCIVDRLKGLFCLFAGHIIPQSAELLNANNTAKTDESYFGDDHQATEKASLLLQYVLDCLYKCFLYDKGGFVTKERFDCLMQPLADQIENTQGGESACQERITDHLRPCVAQLLVAAKDSSSWQPLNYQVLLKTRHSSAKVRFGALTVLQELHIRLSEDYLSLLPETIPFMAELMEDESVEVEEKCQQVVSELEKTLGEPLQKYF
ncbi:HEAT repeat-containing protein 1-like [Amphiura filiformis]|uniref:HEAT repeat-containing protein 1-like n=1 Tax=Amphiura filiformis TaxID=82378 RepID=UPI003B21F4B8